MMEVRTGISFSNTTVASAWPSNRVVAADVRRLHLTGLQMDGVEFVSLSLDGSGGNPTKFNDSPQRV